MEKKLILKNDHLQAEIRLPGSEPESQRFDSAAVISQVTLHGQHVFCQPEQVFPERVTCYGFGLCSEFVMDDVGKLARKGDFFPKPGVGLLRQIEDGRIYDKWSCYEEKKFAKAWENGEDWIIFREEPVVCLGIGLKIRREMRLEENAILLNTIVENVGTERAVLAEYQHNFVAIDNLPVGEGYCLEIPFDGTLPEMERSFTVLSTGEPLADGCVRVEGSQVRWIRTEPDRTWQKITEPEDILNCETYGWKLTHKDSPVSIAEVCGFKPAKLVLWGVEHCICTEAYHGIDLLPGEKECFTRKWIFED